MLYQGLQYFNHNEDQQEVCRTTLLSLWETQCQGQSDEVHDFFFVLPINNKIVPPRLFKSSIKL